MVESEQKANPGIDKDAAEVGGDGANSRPRIDWFGGLQCVCPIHLLIVDDEEPICQVTQKALAHGDMHIETVSTPFDIETKLRDNQGPLSPDYSRLWIPGPDPLEGFELGHPGRHRGPGRDHRDDRLSIDRHRRSIARASTRSIISPSRSSIPGPEERGAAVPGSKGPAADVGEGVLRILGAAIREAAKSQGLHPGPDGANEPTCRSVIYRRSSWARTPPRSTRSYRIALCAWECEWRTCSSSAISFMGETTSLFPAERRPSKSIFRRSHIP